MLNVYVTSTCGRHIITGPFYLEILF